MNSAEFVGPPTHAALVEQAASAFCRSGMSVTPLLKKDPKKWGVGWNQPHKLFNDAETLPISWPLWADGVGVHLATTGLVSLDLDDEALARHLLTRSGLDVDEVVRSGWVIKSGKPNSLRVMYRLPKAHVLIGHRYGWTGRGEDGKPATRNILELRASSPNLQDVLPGSRHPDFGTIYHGFLHGERFEADDLAEHGLDAIPVVPQSLLDLWIRYDEVKAQWDSLNPNMAELPSRLPRAPTKPVSQEVQAVVGWFNDQHTIEEILIEAGYAEVDGRYRRPGSETGAPGITFLDNGLTIYSHGGDVLNDGHKHDAFDCWRLLEHDGDWASALRAVDALRRPPEVVFAGVADMPVFEVARLTPADGDVENGRLFAECWRDKLLHIYETGEWLRMDSATGWVAAPPGAADSGAKVVFNAIKVYAAQAFRSDPDAAKPIVTHVMRTAKLPALRAMVELAKSEPGVTVRATEFDADPMQLGVTNGVLDLSTGRLLAITPRLRVSKRCRAAYDPEAVCPTFLRFLKTVQPEPEMRDFLQRFAGYCLTGQVGEQIWLFLVGTGANGKSVFIELLAYVLGDYARKIPTEM